RGMAVLQVIAPPAGIGDELPGRHLLLLVFAAVLAVHPPFLRQRERLLRDLDARLGAGPEPQRRVLRVRIVSRGRAGPGLLDGNLSEDLRLFLSSAGGGGTEVARAAPGSRGDFRSLGKRRDVLDRLARFAVAPLSVHALVVEEKLGALPDPPLVCDPVE